MKLMIFAAALAVLATPAIAQEEWINRDCAKYSASQGTRTRGIKPGAVSPYILEKLRQKDAPKIKAARQECEWRKQEQIEAKAAREEAERQANIKAARRACARKQNKRPSLKKQNTIVKMQKRASPCATAQCQSTKLTNLPTPRSMTSGRKWT